MKIAQFNPPKMLKGKEEEGAGLRKRNIICML
jgi:hypothetical protein